MIGTEFLRTNVPSVVCDGVFFPSVHCHSVALRRRRLRVRFPPHPAHAVGGVCPQVEHKLVRSSRFLSTLISFSPPENSQLPYLLGVWGG